MKISRLSHKSYFLLLVGGAINTTPKGHAGGFEVGALNKQVKFGADWVRLTQVTITYCFMVS